MNASRGLERLYAVPPAEFTRARNALAAELRAAGDAEGARAVGRLRRPSAPLWAVNQLARSARQPLEKFLNAVDHLRRTQLSDARGATDAMRKQRESLDALVARAGASLREAGVRTSAETTRRLSGMLLGAAVDATHAAELLAGRLTEEPAAPGFEAFAGAPRGRHLRLVPPAREHARTEARRPRARDTARAERERARDEARTERERERARQLEARQRATEEKQRQAEERRREAERRAAEMATLERDAKAARERLAEIDRRLSEARRAARASRARRSGGGRRASPP
jgi:hypothetical protein